MQCQYCCARNSGQCACWRCKGVGIDYDVHEDDVPFDEYLVFAKNWLTEAYKESQSKDLEWIENEFTSFCKNQQVKKAIMTSVDLLGMGDYDSIKMLMNNALKAGEDKNIGHEYDKDIESWVFGPETPKVIVVSRTWKESDFSLNEDTITVQASHIYKSLGDLETDGMDPVFYIAQHVGTSTGLDFRIVPSKMGNISDNARRIFYNDVMK